MGDGSNGMDRLLDELTAIVSAASATILQIRAGSLQTRTKSDQSPVTAADEAAEAIILEGLARVLPGVPVVSEEAVECVPTGDLGSEFVLVDPLDGTRELVAGRDEFTVNVALLKGGRPHLGIVAAPALGLLWRGYPGRGAERLSLAPGGTTGKAEPIRTRTRPASGLVATVSRSHLDPETEGLPHPAAGRDDHQLRIGDQVLPGGGGRGRRLSAFRHDLRMGHRGRPGGAGGGRRHGGVAHRRGVALRPGRRALSRPRLRRVGRSGGRRADLTPSREHAGVPGSSLTGPPPCRSAVRLGAAWAASAVGRS